MRTNFNTPHSTLPQIPTRMITHMQTLSRFRLPLSRLTANYISRFMVYLATRRNISPDYPHPKQRHNRRDTPSPCVFPPPCIQIYCDHICLFSILYSSRMFSVSRTNTGVSKQRLLLQTSPLHLNCLSEPNLTLCEDRDGMNLFGLGIS